MFFSKLEISAIIGFVVLAIECNAMASEHEPIIK